MRYLSVAALGPRPTHQRRWLAICSALQFSVSAQYPNETTATPTICPERGQLFPQLGSYNRC